MAAVGAGPVDSLQMRASTQPWPDRHHRTWLHTLQPLLLLLLHVGHDGWQPLIIFFL